MILLILPVRFLTLMEGGPPGKFKIIRLASLAANVIIRFVSILILSQHPYVYN